MRRIRVVIIGKMGMRLKAVSSITRRTKHRVEMIIVENALIAVRNRLSMEYVNVIESDAMIACWHRIDLDITVIKVALAVFILNIAEAAWPRRRKDIVAATNSVLLAYIAGIFSMAFLRCIEPASYARFASRLPSWIIF